MPPGVATVIARGRGKSALAGQFISDGGHGYRDRTGENGNGLSGSVPVSGSALWRRMRCWRAGQSRLAEEAVDERRQSPRRCCCNWFRAFPAYYSPPPFGATKAPDAVFT